MTMIDVRRSRTRRRARPLPALARERSLPRRDARRAAAGPYARRMPGFFVSEAVTDDVHAQFVEHGGRFYGAYVALRDPATWITHAAIAAFDAAHPDPPVLDWYPAEADDR
jgi:hypothetical protein